MKSLIVNFVCAAILQLAGWGVLCAQEIHMSYPGLTGESAPFVAREAGFLKGYGIDAKLV
jgi:membrane glycosyltransferase